MSLRSYSIIMLLATALAWVLWVAVMQLVDPFVTNWIGFSLFYATLFLALIGSSVIVGFLLRIVVLRQTVEAKLVKDAFRQSFLFAILIIASLILQSQDLFSWLNLFFLVAALGIFEYFWLSFEK